MDRRPRVEDRTRGHPHRGTPCDGPGVQGHRAGRAADDDGDRPVGPQRAPGERGLQDGGVPGVAEQPVGEPHRGCVEGAGAGNSQVGVAGSARVLDRGEGSGPYQGDLGGHARPPSATNRTWVPGVRSAAASRDGSHSGAGSGMVPISCQPPGVARGYTAV